MSNLNTITYDKTTRAVNQTNLNITASSFIGASQLTISGSSLINPIKVVSSNNSFSEIDNQNKSNGADASSDIVATNDIGNENTYYVNLGINSSGYTASIVGQSNDAYLYNTGSNFYIGNATPNKNLYLFAGGLVDTSSVSVSSGGSLSATIITASAGMAVGGYSLGVPVTNSIQIGYQTGKSTGLNNSAIQIGYRAGQNTVTASSAVQIGINAGQNTVTASSAVQIGINAGYGSTNAINAVQIGNAAGQNATTATNAVQIGNNAGYGSTNAINAVQIGNAAGFSSTNTANAVQIGINAGRNSTNATESVQIGDAAGYNSTTATYAVQIGNSAGFNTTIATSAVQIGQNCGFNCRTASNAVQVGVTAGQNATTATNAVQIGYLAGYDATNSTEVVHVGVGAGWHATNANYTTFLGAYADTLAAALNVAKSIAIGYNAKVSGSNMCVIGGTGADAVNVGIGLTNPAYKIQLSSDSAGKPGVGGLWTVVSDKRIKTDIKLADLDRCYEIIKEVPLKHFGWKDGVYTTEQVKDRHNLGWIAQDVQKVFPKATSIKPFKNDNVEINDCIDLNGGQMYMAMYGALQKAIQKIELLEQEIEILKSK